MAIYAGLVNRDDDPERRQNAFHDRMDDHDDHGSANLSSVRLQNGCVKDRRRGREREFDSLMNGNEHPRGFAATIEGNPRHLA